MRVKLGWVPRLFSILFIIVIFVCLNVLWTTSSLSHLTSKSAFNASKFRLSFDTVYITNATGRADAIKTALATNNDLKFLETGYLSKNISTDTAGTTPASLQYFLTTLQLGQLGNNMFQYAGILGLAKINGRKPFFPISSLVRQVFKISHVETIKEASTWRRLHEANFGKYETVYEHLPEGNLTLAAYLQSYKYFQSIDKDIRQEFQFREGIQRRAMGLIKFLRPKIGTRTPIGVHVRRFDLLTQKEIRLGSLTAPRSYFQQAFAWMRSRHGDVVFLVASDDPDWCKENILQGDDVILMPHATADVHLCALATCRHVIMSVGTFGWWAGWLGGGDVIYYTKPHVPGSAKYKGFVKDDFFPLHWIGIGDSADSVTESLQSGQIQGQVQSSGVEVVAHVGLNTTGGGAGMVGTKETAGLTGVPVVGTKETFGLNGVPIVGLSAAQQNIPSGLESPLSSSVVISEQPNIAPGPNNQVALNELLPGQQKPVNAENGPVSSMAIVPGSSQQKVAPGLGVQNSVAVIQRSPQDLGLQNMWKNQALLQATGLAQTMKPADFSGNVNEKSAVVHQEIPNLPIQLGKGVNAPAGNPTLVGVNPNGNLPNMPDLKNSMANSQSLINSSETTESGKSAGNALLPENTEELKVLTNAGQLPISNSGKNIATGLPSYGMAANNVQNGPNFNVEAVVNTDPMNAGKDAKGILNSIPNSDIDIKLNHGIDIKSNLNAADVNTESMNAGKDAKEILNNIPNRDIEIKLNPNAAAEQSIDLTPEALKALLANGKLNELAKPATNAAEPPTAMGLKLGLNMGTTLSDKDGGPQVLDRPGQENTRVTVSNNVGTAEKSPTDQNIENKEMA